MQGLFITFEGLDGSGKTTQVDLLHKYISQQRPIFTTREPGGTGVGEKIREILKTSFMEPMTELFLFYASRVEHTQKIIMPMLNRGYVVVCDRFIDSTLAYQVYGRGIDKKIIDELNEISVKGLKPDLTIFIDLPTEVAYERNIKRGKLDRIESEALDFYKKVADGYKAIVEEDRERFLVIDGLENRENIFEKIKTKVDELLRR